MADSPAPNHEHDTVKNEKSEVVRYCDNEQLADTYAIARLLVDPTCSGAPSKLATALFEFGAALGGWTGEESIRMRATLDVLRDFPVDHDAGDRLLEQTKQLYGLADQREKSEIRKAIAKHADNDCLDAAVALQIIRSGAGCGFGAVETSVFKEAYRKVYVPICTPFAGPQDCAARADTGFDRYASEYRTTVARELKKREQ